MMQTAFFDGGVDGVVATEEGFYDFDSVVDLDSKANSKMLISILRKPAASMTL